MAESRPKLAFIFVAPGADPVKQRAVITLDALELVVVGVADYTQAVSTSQALVKEGVVGIELCAGFGNAGVAKVAAAVPGVSVGAVRFDAHPALGYKSGDEVFA